MPFKYSKLTEESPSFFLLRSLEFSKIFLYYDNINSPSTAGVQMRTVWKEKQNKIWNCQIFLLPLYQQTRKDMEKKIREIVESYKGVTCGYLNVSKHYPDYITMVAIGLKNRYMPFAAKKILEAFPQIKWVHFTGGWQEYVYSRETLKWAGFKLAN